MVDASELISSSYDTAFTALASKMGISLETLVIIMGAISIWALIWKGFALWKSAKKNQLVWFIVLLAVNTMGILEILYIFVFSKLTGKAEKENKKSKKR